jgi:hypothetical protein
MNAFLNISYNFIGQITLSSLIAEMKNPYDFRKCHHCRGHRVQPHWRHWCFTCSFRQNTANQLQYMDTRELSTTSGSLGNDVYKKISFSFMIPTLIFLGVLYAPVSARFVFFCIFEYSRHKSSHTVVGWATWTAILAATWVLTFIITEVIPFFSDLLSLMSSLFDSFFGWIF